MKINFRIIKKGEKQDKIKDKNDLEVMLINLKSKQRLENLDVYEVPEDISGPAITDKWGNLQNTEDKYDDAMQKALKRMKDLEKDLNRFNSLSDKVINWHADKEKFLKDEIKQNEELPVIRAKINTMKSFSNELKAMKASQDKANDVGKKVIDGEHSSAKEVEKTIQKMKKLHEATEELEKKKGERLQVVLKFLEDMETKSVELSSKTDKLNSQFSASNSHLSELISSNTSKDVEELQHELEEIKKNHQGPHKQSLDDILVLEKNIKANGGDPSQYSSISADGLKKKYEDINNKINQKTEGLKKKNMKNKAKMKNY